MPNFRLELCYDGTRFDGWQRQGNTPNTIQGLLERALSELLEQEIEVAGSGRTDAGVHARRQVASFRAKTKMPPETILANLRKKLPADVGAISLTEAQPRFHARLNCTSKTYVYRIWNSETPNVFERKYVLPVPEPLDLEAMRSAADHLCGTHDFTSFHANKRFKRSAVRTVTEIGIEKLGEEVQLRFTGDGFLYHMVRILTGTMIEVGLGQREADSVPEILAAMDRARAGKTAPARGLILWDVGYDKEKKQIHTGQM